MHKRAMSIVAILIIAGIIFWIIWAWYFFPLAIFCAYVLGSLYSIFESKRLKRITGLDFEEQQIAFSESLLAQRHPLTQDREKYLEYINSLPD